VRKVITFDKGSKRRLNEIRWKLIEVFSLALLAVFLIAIGMAILFWELQHEHPYAEPSKVPQFKNTGPKEP
jgi:hypothetical protein